MRCVFVLMLIGAGLAVCVPRAGAADVSKLSEADREQVNRWMAQRATVMIDAHTLETEVRSAWLKSANTSPDIEALRKRYRELQQELARTEREIQAKVLELPAVQVKVRQIEEAKKTEQELTKKIGEKVGE